MSSLRIPEFHSGSINELNLIGDVNSDMVEKVKALFDYPISLHRPRDLRVFLSSDGGDTGCSFAIYDLIRTAPKSVVLTTGMCASAAVTILQAGKIRLATPTTQFLVHEVRFFDNVPLEAADQTIVAAIRKESERDRTYLTRVNEDIMIQRMGSDNFGIAKERGLFDADTALRLNLIDGIFDPDQEKPKVRLRFNAGLNKLLPKWA